MNLYSDKCIERLQNDDALKVLAVYQSQLAECTVLAGAVKGLACSEIVFGREVGETLCWSVVWYTSSTRQAHIYHNKTDTNLHSHYYENLRYNTQLQSSACSADKPIATNRLNTSICHSTIIGWSAHPRGRGRGGCSPRPLKNIFCRWAGIAQSV
jgi:hypothetical protein